MVIGSIGKIRISIGTRDKEIPFPNGPIRTPELSARFAYTVIGSFLYFGCAPWDFRPCSYVAILLEVSNYFFVVQSTIIHVKTMHPIAGTTHNKLSNIQDQGQPRFSFDVT